MNIESDFTELRIQGEHLVEISRQQLWESLNDPEVLQGCIKGCDVVEKISDETFVAGFKIRVGPFKKSFKASLDVVNANPPSQYQLISRMNAGVAGTVDGKADVKLEFESDQSTRLNYIARVKVSGWIGELGIKLLGKTAKRYMHQFFENIVAVIEQKNHT